MAQTFCTQKCKNVSKLFLLLPMTLLVDVSDYFYFFSARGGGRGSPRRREQGGGSTLNWKSQEGSPGGEGPRGREGVCGEIGELGGGRAKYFFFGPKCPPSSSLPKKAMVVAFWCCQAHAACPRQMCRTCVRGSPETSPENL